MATQHGLHGFTRSAQSEIRDAQADQPLNRRRALRVLGALGAAAAGAAALSAARPEEASAVTSGTLWYTSATTSSPFGTIEGDNTGSGDGVYGSSASGNGVEGTTSAASSGVNGPAGVVGWTNAVSGAGVIGQANGTNGLGVWGQGSGSNGNGVYGLGNNIGVVGTGTSGAGTGVFGQGGYYGVQGDGSTYGVFGFSSGGYGLAGEGGTTGVVATGGQDGVAANGSNTGVYGTGGTYGVYGTSSTGVGVYGTSNSSSNTKPGVYGVNTGGGPAIVGQATGSGFGFSAVTQTGTGCFGGASGSGTGVFAYSIGGTALSALAAGGGNIAGYFGGPVIITGALSVMGAKSAAVRAPDGGLRRLYSLESPESWFEDFGTGQLSGGSATVQLEPVFAALVHGDNYHVFFTPRGEPKGLLYVSKQSPSSFTVQESGGGTSSIGFSYRVVAKRKDIPGARLEHVDEPPTPEVPTFPTIAPTPNVPPFPTLPTHTPAPAIPQGHGPER